MGFSFPKEHLTNHPVYIPTYLFYLVTIIAAIGCIILAFLSFIYYLNRINILNKKLHFLTKQTDQRCLEEWRNSRVDYIKSIFVTLISAFEMFPYLIIPAAIVIANNINGELKPENCSKIVENISHCTIFRAMIALGASVIILNISLVHTLTFYLCHAYSVKRNIRFTIRDGLQLVWVIPLIFIIWISIISLEAFIITLLISGSIGIIGHLYLNYKYTRRLYRTLRVRRLDAWFEDIRAFKEIDQMCREYRIGSILYFAFFLLVIILGIYELGFLLIFALLKNDCFIISFGVDLKVFHSFYLQNRYTMNILDQIFLNLIPSFICMLVFIFFFSLHLFIIFQASKRMIRRYKIMKFSLPSIL